MEDLVAVTGLAPNLEQAGLDPNENFEVLYERLLEDPARNHLARKAEVTIRSYFERLVLPRTVTLYDRLLISLRRKDAVATFNWDPLLAQAYLRNRQLRELPRILFLHGNVAIGTCTEHRRKGFVGGRCDACATPLMPTPLLYPIGRKNYDQDPFIRGEWAELREILETTYIFTIIGYAAPESDVEAKAILLQAWDANQTKELAQIDIVDIKPRTEIERTWAPFFVRNHYGVSTAPSWLFQHARRSCDHFAMATLQQNPCHDTPLPATDDLGKLQGWARSLIEQEIALRDHEIPFPC